MKKERGFLPFCESKLRSLVKLLLVVGSYSSYRSWIHGRTKPKFSGVYYNCGEGMHSGKEEKISNTPAAELYV